MGQEVVAKILIDFDVDLNGGGGTMALLFASVIMGQDSMTKLLLDCGADPNLTESSTGFTPLFYTVQEGRANIVKTLLNNGANPYHKAKDGIMTICRSLTRPCHGRTALSHAAKAAYERITRLLLDKTTSQDIQDKICRTPLFYAIDSGKESVLTLLLEAGPYLEHVDTLILCHGYGERKCGGNLTRKGSRY